MRGKKAKNRYVLVNHKNKTIECGGKLFTIAEIARILYVSESHVKDCAYSGDPVCGITLLRLNDGDDYNENRKVFATYDIADAESLLMNSSKKLENSAWALDFMLRWDETTKKLRKYFAKCC